MEKSLKFLAALITVISLCSFAQKDPSDFIGTYGVTSSDPSQIKLIINSDNTFYYQDFSAPDKKIAVNGNWTLKGNKVYLKGNSTNEKFHNIWSFSENGQSAKSHRGLTFYRLCKIDK